MKSYAKRLLACILAIAMVMSSVPAAFASTEGYGTSTASVATDANGTATNPNGSATNPNGSATNPNGSATNPNGSATNPDGEEYVSIEAIEFEDLDVYEGSRGRYKRPWDAETEEYMGDYYYHYYIANYNYTVTMSDGTVITNKSLEDDDLYSDEIYFEYLNHEYYISFESDQCSEMPWSIGVHTVTAYVNEVSDTFNYTILESPIESIVFEPKESVEGTNGRFLPGISESTGESSKYFLYEDTYNYNYIVYLKNNETIEHSNESENVGFYYNGCYFDIDFETDQSVDAPWSVGVHQVIAKVGMYQTTYSYTITESPIRTITFEPIDIIEGTHGWFVHEDWFRYATDGQFNDLVTGYTIEMKDGTKYTFDKLQTFTYEGNEFKFGLPSDDQSNTNAWSVGEHTMYVDFSSFCRVPITVNIVKSSISTINVAPITLIEGEDGRYKWGYNEETDEEYRYFWYDTETVDGSVTMEDGTVVNFEKYNDDNYEGIGFYYDNEFYRVYFTDDQEDKPWSTGNYEITVIVGGHKKIVPVQIVNEENTGEDKEECESHDLSLDPSDYIDYPSYVAPTCTESGSVIYQCGECSFEKVIEFEATGHEWSEEENIVKEPTCTESGELLQVCVNCDQTKTVEIPATNQHDYVTIIGYEPTCTEDGLSDGEYCVECGIFKIEQNVIPATGHTEVVHAGKAPTCTENGLTDAIYCSVCDEYVKESDSIDPLGHTEVIHAGKAPTCTEHGFTDAVYCSVCEEYVKESDYIEPLGHTEVTIPATPATCLTNGLTAGTYCSVCNETIVEQQAIPAFNHLWDLGTVTKSATCTEEGVFTYTCMNADCDEIKTSVVPATGHKEVTITGKAATCTETGLTDGKKCETCGTVTVAQETIKTLGHKEVVDTAIAPTCTEAGLTAGSHCSVCHTVIKAQEVVKATGHQHTKTVVTTKATTTKNGKLTTRCTDCSEALSTKTIYRAKTVKLSYTKAVYSGKIKSPKVIIKDSKGKTISSKNYTIKKATGRKNVGKYTYKITFKNQYKGTKTLYLTINPKTTSITKKPTAIKKGFTVKWKKVSKQASGYEIMYSTSKNFTKKTTKTSLVKSYKTTSKKITKLKAKKTYYVKVRTYKTVNGKKYYSAWSKVKTVKTK